MKKGELPDEVAHRCTYRPAEAGGSPPAEVNAFNARTNPRRSRGGILPAISAITARRREVTSWTTPSPCAVSSTTNSRRDRGCGRRSIKPTFTKRSTMRPVVDGCTPNNWAKVAKLICPSLDKITNVRNWGKVIVSSTSAIDRAEMANSSREATNSESVRASSDSSRSASSTVTPFPFQDSPPVLSRVIQYRTATIA